MKKPIELMRLIRMPADRRLVIQVRGHQFNTFGDIPDERVKAVLLESLKDLLNDVCGDEVLRQIGYAKLDQTSVVADPLPISEETDRKGGISTEEGPVDVSKQRAAFLASLEQSPDVPETQSPRSGGILGRLRSRPKPPAESPSVGLPILNIASQIHELVQQELQQFPELQGRELTIRQNPDSGLLIMVDGQQYEDVAEISDPQIRMVIKNAIKKWEGSH